VSEHPEETFLITFPADVVTLKDAGEVLLPEVAQLREERATLEHMCRYFAAKFRGQDNVPGKVAAKFFERFGN
jgi:hypothetical protein